MILNAVVKGTYRYAETWPEMLGLITEAMNGLRPEKIDVSWISPGDNICFMFADERHTADTRSWWPDNFLYFSVNSSTGYGGLTWFVGAERAERESNGISDCVWVSDNPTPPGFDPRVVSDPGFPLFYDPRSTLPILQVRAALEEFCRVGTGDRPECIQWVRGEMNGRRLDGGD